MITAPTLPRMLDDVAARQPGATLHFRSTREDLTLEQLAEGSRAFAGSLLARGVRKGDPVGVVLPTGRDFLLAFFGVLRAGALPCPLALPHAFRSAEVFFERVDQILADAGMRHLVGRASLLAEAAGAQAGRVPPDLCMHDPGEVLHAGAPAADAAIEAEDIALVQYTSGSTAAPKGVALTHQSFLAGMNAVIHGIRLTADDVNGQWLPLYHDMGLIGMLCGVACGVEQHIWSPFGFLKNPAAWLAEFARVRATIYAGPSFSFEAMLAGVDDDALADLDLSAWRVAFNGAEPIQAAVIERFVERFGRAGFAPCTMFPVYGLAEITLAATFPAPGSAPEIAWIDRDALAREDVARRVPRDHARAHGVVSVGRPVLGQELEIRGEGGAALPEGQVGEIALRGSALMHGYYRSPERTAEVLRDGWLRTGDLGFVLDGKLHVTGRSKEMIIVRGMNLYPVDVETLVRERLGATRGGCVAFAVSGGEEGAAGRDEHIAVLVEARPVERERLARAAAEARAALASQLGADVVEIHLVQPRAIERTTSGKQQRLIMRRRFLDGALDDCILHSDDPSGS
jgi:fatty-acyl-CoA synthase